MIHAKFDAGLVERLAIELNPLETRLQRLRDFIAGPVYLTLSERQQDLLRKQVGVMQEYRDILRERLKIVVNES